MAARTIINETLLTTDAGLDSAGSGVYQTGDNSNGMYLPATAASAVAKRKAGTLILHAKNTNGSSRTVTLKAGSGDDQGPAWRKGLGDLVVTVGATTGEQLIHVTDTARFKQSDGTINVDISGANVTIAAFRVAEYF